MCFQYCPSRPFPAVIPPYLPVGSTTRRHKRCSTCVCLVRCLSHRGVDSLLFKAKLFAMATLMVCDIGLNSSVEHDGLSGSDADSEMDSREADSIADTILVVILG